MSRSETGLAAFVAAAPQPQRAGMRMMVALVRRPRGARLLKLVAPMHQLANGLATMARYEESDVSVKLGWDADAVAARGRALRREEGRL